VSPNFPAVQESIGSGQAHCPKSDTFQILQAQGKYQNQPPLPFVLGAEFAGKIAKDSPVPKGCPFKPGDRVFGASQGSYAEQVAADWRSILPLPAALSFDQGAGAKAVQFIAL
jgi:NADPH:quinone reductase